MNLRIEKRGGTSLSFLLQASTGFLLLALVTVVFIACNSSAGTSPSLAPSAPVLPVITLVSSTATTHLEFSASVEGTRDVEIRPQVDGYIERIFIDEGAYVKKGQTLFQINSRPFREQLNSAQANLASAKATLANAEINVSKLKPLVQNNVISEVQLKSAQTAYDAAAANVSQAKAMLGSAQVSLGFATIKAPADGYVGRIPHKTGSLVGTTTQEPLTVISDIKDVYAYFSMSESDFMKFKNEFEGKTIEEKIKKMPPVELVLPDGSVYPEKGRVQLVAGQFDNSVGSISFRASFPNTDRTLRSGNTGKVRVPQLHTESIVVPQEATFEVQDKIFVFAVSDSNKVQSKPIGVAGKTSTYYFVNSGLTAGEKIVFAGTGNLQDGMVIQPQLLSTDSLLKAKPL